MEPSLDRRRLGDRRRHATTLWRALRLQGRRTGFRRALEGHQAYVDGLTWPTVGLVLVVYGGSILDALLTLLYVQDGGGEANPLMQLALVQSQTCFLVVKIGSTGAAAWLFGVHQQWPLAVRGLYGLTVVYGTVLVYHLVLCFQLA